MKLSENIKSKAISTCFEPDTKEQLIHKLIDTLCDAHELSELKPLIIQAVFSRESQMSTGIGCGLAVPHAKVKGIKHLTLAAVNCPKGVDFNSLDDEPVTLAFLILSPENIVGPHIHALSSVSRLMADSIIRKQLIEADSSENFLEGLKQGEVQYV
jgi:mannitol/fructose-specific phosphotransferase system IIA component (Ntr-type)